MLYITFKFDGRKVYILVNSHMTQGNEGFFGMLIRDEVESNIASPASMWKDDCVANLVLRAVG